MRKLLEHTQSPQSHWLVAIYAWGCRLVIMGARFWTMSLLLRYLGVNFYAVFSIIASFEGWFLLCDFGLGPSVQNLVSETQAQNQSSAMWLLSIMQLAMAAFVVFLLLLFLIGPLIGKIFFSSYQDATQVVLAFQLAGLLYGITAIGSIAYRVLMAFHRGHLSYLLQAVASVVSLICSSFLFSSYSEEGSLIYATLVTLAPSALVASISFFRLFPIRSLFASYQHRQIQQIARRAFHFLGFGLMTTAILSIDYFVMMDSLPSRDIVVYNLFSRLFLAAFSIYALLLQASWPLCSEWMTRQLDQKLNRLAKRYCFYGILFIGVITVGIHAFAFSILHLFSSDPALTISTSTIGLFGLYYVIRVICDVYSMLLQSRSEMEIFWWIGPIQALLSYSLQSVLVSYLGLNGILLGLISTFALTTFWLLPWLVHRTWWSGHTNNQCTKEKFK